MRTLQPGGFFRNLRLGMRVSLQTDDNRPVFVPYENDCIAATTCLNADFDVVPGEPLRFVVSQPTGTAVALYDQAGTLVRVIDVRSSLFKRTGESLQIPSRSETGYQWMGSNSTIYRVFATADYLIVTHVLVDLPHHQVGDVIKYKAWISVYDTNGHGLISDVALPDVPIARDRENLYVLDYGANGRRASANVVTIRRINIKQLVSRFRHAVARQLVTQHTRRGARERSMTR